MRQALEHFKDTRDPALAQQVEADVAQKYANQETTELKRLREENNILRKGVRALNQRNNKWCKAEEELKEAANEIKNLRFRNTLLQQQVNPGQAIYNSHEMRNDFNQFGGPGGGVFWTRIGKMWAIADGKL